MNRTNLEPLLQATAPIVERMSFNLPRVDERSPGFGDHLSQASSTTQSDLNTAGRTGEQPAPNDTSSNDLETSLTEPSQSETAPTAESTAVNPHEHNSEESPGLKEICSAETTPCDGISAPVIAEEVDSKHDAEEEDELQDAVVVAIEVGISKPVEIIAPSPELNVPQELDDATVKIRTSGNAVKADQSDRHATPEQLTAETTKVDAPSVKVAVATFDKFNQPATPDQPVEETATLQPRASNLPATERESPAQRKTQVEVQVAVAELDGDVATSPNAATATKDTASINLTNNEPVLSERKPSTEENRDADAPSSPPQRSDATALGNKILTAAVANGAVTQPERNTSPKDAAEGSDQPGKTLAAKVDGVVDAANRLHANTSSSKRGGRSNGVEEMPRIDPARFVGRVAKAFHTAHERGGTLQIRLSPPELGAMRLELTVKDGVMTATLETENASARRVLLEHLPALRDRLAEQSIRVERFDVDVRRENAGDQPDPRTTQDQHQQQQGHSEQRRRQVAQPPVAETTRQLKPITLGQTNNNGINLVA